MLDLPSTVLSVIPLQGSGKTGAFALPIIEALLKNPAPLFALVISPTRELAAQIEEHFQVHTSDQVCNRRLLLKPGLRGRWQAIGKGIGLKTVAVMGGIDAVPPATRSARRAARPLPMLSAPAPTLTPCAGGEGARPPVNIIIS